MCAGTALGARTFIDAGHDGCLRVDVRGKFYLQLKREDAHGAGGVDMGDTGVVTLPLKCHSLVSLPFIQTCGGRRITRIIPSLWTGGEGSSRGEV